MEETYWELAATLVETLTGERPYIGEPLEDVCEKVSRAIERANQLKTIAMN